MTGREVIDLNKRRNPSCPCTKQCELHGECDACMQAHFSSGTRTACGRTADGGKAGLAAGGALFEKAVFRLLE